MQKYEVVSVTNKDGSASQSVGAKYVGHTLATVFADFYLRDFIGRSASFAIVGEGNYLDTSTVEDVQVYSGEIKLITRNTIYTLKDISE